MLSWVKTKIDLYSESAERRIGRAHVVGEDEEGRAEWADAAVGRHAVDRAAHGMLADAEVDIAAVVAPAAAERALDLLAAGWKFGSSKSPAPFMPVMVEGLRSAEPPMKVGTFGKNAGDDRLAGLAGGDPFRRPAMSASRRPSRPAARRRSPASVRRPASGCGLG